MTAAPYPERPSERDRWILALRDRREDVEVDATKPAGFFVEDELAASGQIAATATVLLTNRECAWRCLMCDLWRHTLQSPTPPGAIPMQLDYALARMPPAKVIKLYNSGSFFDVQAIPPEDHAEIASRLHAFERVIVECHPALVNEKAGQFRSRLSGRLEVAMGLETVHPEILPRLNKRMTLGLFADAAERLRAADIDLRVFVLVKPPFLEEESAVEWALRSVQFAFHCGATAVSLIPTRAGNGAMDALAERGEFSQPLLSTFEAALDEALRIRRGRVFADLWDLERFSTCTACFPARKARLQEMNLRQRVLPRVDCGVCTSDV